MKDNEIIKALECCLDAVDDGDTKTFDFLSAVIDLINRQKSEIEKLEIELQAMRNAANGYKAENERLYRIIADKDYSFAEVTAALRLAKELLETERSEAIKEFTERLKESVRLEDDCEYDCGQCCYECKEYVPIIDNIVKEMMEEKQNER